jgi:hypothetical protein
MYDGGTQRAALQHLPGIRCAMMCIAATLEALECDSTTTSCVAIRAHRRPTMPRPRARRPAPRRAPSLRRLSVERRPRPVPPPGQPHSAARPSRPPGRPRHRLRSGRRPPRSLRGLRHPARGPLLLLHRRGPLLSPVAGPSPELRRAAPYRAAPPVGLPRRRPRRPGRPSRKRPRLGRPSGRPRFRRGSRVQPGSRARAGRRTSRLEPSIASVLPPGKVRLAAPAGCPGSSPSSLHAS